MQASDVRQAACRSLCDIAADAPEDHGLLLEAGVLSVLSDLLQAAEVAAFQPEKSAERETALTECHHDLSDPTRLLHGTCGTQSTLLPYRTHMVLRVLDCIRT
jgi:hypothetical protein